MNTEAGRGSSEFVPTAKVSRLLEEIWYGDHPLSLLLAPLGWLYDCCMRIRRLAYHVGVLPARRVSAPVVVVGNITVGGAGKTPLVIWLCEFLREQGFHPGVISRGYGGQARKFPQQVRPDSDPGIVGDEPLLIARRTGVPVAISPDRYTAARQLLEHTDCDILVCDDGLQHLGLYRDLEIVVIDGERPLGNRRCLPAGPLRETADRLNTVDMVVMNGGNAGRYHLMEMETAELRSVAEPGRSMESNALAGQRVHAVAGIGNPQRFFSQLRKQGMEVIRHIFPDHHVYRPADLSFNDELPVVMTEKDAVKCQGFAHENCWYQPISSRMAMSFVHRLTVLLKEIADG